MGGKQRDVAVVEHVAAVEHQAQFELAAGFFEELAIGLERCEAALVVEVASQVEVGQDELNGIVKSQYVMVTDLLVVEEGSDGPEIMSHKEPGFSHLIAGPCIQVEPHGHEQCEAQHADSGSGLRHLASQSGKQRSYQGIEARAHKEENNGLQVKQVVDVQPLEPAGEFAGSQKRGRYEEPCQQDDGDFAFLPPQDGCADQRQGRGQHPADARHASVVGKQDREETQALCKRDAVGASAPHVVTFEEDEQDGAPGLPGSEEDGRQQDQEKAGHQSVVPVPMAGVLDEQRDSEEYQAKQDKGDKAEYVTTPQEERADQHGRSPSPRAVEDNFDKPEVCEGDSESHIGQRPGVL